MSVNPISLQLHLLYSSPKAARKILFHNMFYDFMVVVLRIWLCFKATTKVVIHLNMYELHFNSLKGRTSQIELCKLGVNFM